MQVSAADRHESCPPISLRDSIDLLHNSWMAFDAQKAPKYFKRANWIKDEYADYEYLDDDDGGSEGNGFYSFDDHVATMRDLTDDEILFKVSRNTEFEVSLLSDEGVEETVEGEGVDEESEEEEIIVV